MVGPPIRHPFLDLLAVLDPLRGYRRDQSPGLTVRGEPQPDELGGSQLVDRILLIRREQIVKAESFLETNDTILGAEREDPGVKSDDNQCKGHK